MLELVVTPVLIAAAAPVMAATAAAVLITSGRPVLYEGPRVGRDEVTFGQLKFRTMRDLHDASGRPLSDGERITRFGRFLRGTSLDELPQLFNILRGDMSFVGPRPLPLAYLPRYSPEQRQRHLVRPGLTGLAQTSGRNLLAWDERFALDVHYARHGSFLLDAKIVWRTVGMVLRRTGISAQDHATAPEFLGPAARPAVRMPESSAS